MQDTFAYCPRNPESTVLYSVVAENLETFLAMRQERARPVPAFIEREFKSYLACGILEGGFLRLRCESCGKNGLLAFSCKNRGFCNSCGGRRMADTAARLVDRVIPAVPVRQWVLSLPYSLRFRLAFDSGLMGEVLGIFIHEVFRSLRKRANDNGVPNGECASVTFVQRFGSALNLTPHFHSAVFDGVYACTAEEEQARFYPLRPPNKKDVVAVVERVAVRMAALLEARDGTADAEEPALADLYATSVTRTLATGPNAGQKVKTAGEFQEESFENHGSRCAMASGFSVHAGVGIRASDRKGLERLLRYAGRPPIAVDRLAHLPDGRLSYKLKTPWRNGATHVIFEPLEFLARLAVLVPAPRVNIIRFHGQLAPSAKWREAIVPESPDDEHETDPCDCGDCRSGKKKPRRNYSWAFLMARVFEIDVLKCSDCNGRLKILAAIHPPINTRKILECMGLPSRAPPIARAVSESTLEEW